MKGARLLVVIWALAVACPAWGHAFLERAEPRVGSTVRSAPPQVRVWFTQNLEPAFSTLEVANERGERVDQGVTQPDPDNPAALRIALKPIGTGTYQVKWRVLSVDTHVTEGDFTFKVHP